MASRMSTQSLPFFLWPGGLNLSIFDLSKVPITVISPLRGLNHDAFIFDPCKTVALITIFLPV